MLPFHHLFQAKRMRNSLAAREILFTNPFYRFFFGWAGRAIPIVRGAGINQEGVYTALDKLNQGEWVHIFSEGKVNQTGKMHALRWGIGKLVAEAKRTPIVLPFYHTGFEKIMPEKKIYIPRPFGKTLGIMVGEPIDLADMVQSYVDRGVARDDPMLRIEITNQIQTSLLGLEFQLYKWRDEGYPHDENSE
eukprot:TRINITY_DN1556_c0_g1_i2.p1 TRINITY_DN1556_c0_g1~~TRINITY_DN1556_c0_g1_i2.p1  ORF type:complete len:191 (-),score=34.13 TRINITY_DN1556_c0_g1_i2:18-590(-)